jgi:hypothetical protein
MGKGLAIFGLILMIVGILPLFLPMLGFPEIAAYFYMLGLYSIDLAGYLFSELMLILIGLGFILLIVGAMR